MSLFNHNIIDIKNREEKVLCFNCYIQSVSRFFVLKSLIKTKKKDRIMHLFIHKRSSFLFPPFILVKIKSNNHLHIINTFQTELVERKRLKQN